MASLSTCHMGLWLGWQILLNLRKVLEACVVPVCVCGKGRLALTSSINRQQRTAELGECVN